MEENKKPTSLMTDITDEFEQEDIASHKAMGILASLYWLVLIPIFKEKESKYVRFNANQGLAISILYTALVIVNWIFHRIPVLKVLIGIICYLGETALVVLMVICFVNAIMGRVKKFPFVGDIKILK